MRFIAFIVRFISSLNTVVGNICAWLSLAIVLVCFAIVIQRYVFSTSVVWMRDLYVWLNGAMFTAAAGFTLLRDEHVRVDIFYRPASIHCKAIIDLIGVVIFLLPFCLVIWLYGWPFVLRAWRFHEASSNIGGMPGYYILKTFILGFALLVGLQGVALALRSILVLTGREQLLSETLRYKRNESQETRAI